MYAYLQMWLVGLLNVNVFHDLWSSMMILLQPLIHSQEITRVGLFSAFSFLYFDSKFTPELADSAFSAGSKCVTHSTSDLPARTDSRAMRCTSRKLWAFRLLLLWATLDNSRLSMRSGTGAVVVVEFGFTLLLTLSAILRWSVLLLEESLQHI